MNENNVYYTVYKTTNTLNGKIYVGCHITNSLEDGYLGSGLCLIRAVNKYGIDSFKKEILFCFDNKVEMFKKEKEIVNEDFIIRKDNYNLSVGGSGGWNSKGFVSVKDENGKPLRVKNTDTRYLSGELVGITKGLILVVDKNDDVFYVEKNDSRILTGELIIFHSEFISVKDGGDKVFRVKKNDPRVLSGELISLNKNRICVKDKSGKSFWVKKDDSRLLSGELIHFRKNSIISKETRIKISKSLKESVKGRCWITKQGENRLIYISNKDGFINDGWIVGRDFTRIWINKNGVLKSVKQNELESYLKNGWIKGNNRDMNGNNNPAFGRKWLHKENKNKYIKAEDIDSFLSNGWTLGKCVIKPDAWCASSIANRKTK